MSYPQSSQRFWIKLMGTFSLVRGGNILVLALSQFLVAYYLMAPPGPLKKVWLDAYLFCLVLATAMIASAGYILNNFFDAAKDQINRPKKYLLRHLLSQREQLTLFFLLNGAGIILAAAVSFKAVLFFGCYSLLIYAYSVFFKRLYWISNGVAAFIVLLPFYVLALYYDQHQKTVYTLAVYLYLLLLIRDMIKDLANYKGDFAQRYQTLPIVFGAMKTKMIISGIVVIAAAPLGYLYQHLNGQWLYFLLGSYPLLLLSLPFLWKASTQKAYLWLHNAIKSLIFLGVLSIYWSNK
ncbi:MAG: geranylgeranylglycerol-phosphate geranylgeranyltransferase [Flavobacteriaceae bacterium]